MLVKQLNTLVLVDGGEDVVLELALQEDLDAGVKVHLVLQVGQEIDKEELHLAGDIALFLLRDVNVL